MAGIQHVIRQVQRFFQRCAAKGQILPLHAGGLLHQRHVKVRQTAVPQNQVLAGVLVVGPHPRHRLAGACLLFQAKVIVRFKGDEKRQPRQHRQGQQPQPFENVFQSRSPPLH